MVGLSARAHLWMTRVSERKCQSRLFTFSCCSVLGNIKIYALSTTFPYKITSHTIHVTGPSQNPPSARSSSSHHPRHQHQLLSATAISDAMKGLANRAGAGVSGAVSPMPPEDKQKSETGRSEGKLLGELDANGTLLGMKIWTEGIKEMACVWTDKGVQVSPCRSSSCMSLKFH